MLIGEKREVGGILLVDGAIGIGSIIVRGWMRLISVPFVIAAACGCFEVRHRQCWRVPEWCLRIILQILFCSMDETEKELWGCDCCLSLGAEA